MKDIFLLGATGSIGTQTLDIIRNNQDDFRLVAFSSGYNLKLTKEIIEEFQPKAVAMIRKEDAEYLQKQYPNIELFYGDEGLISIATYQSNTKGILLNAVFGSVGLLATIEAIKIKRTIAIANKEILVAAGEIITNLAREYQVDLLPVDSEHSAIFQCIQGENKKDIDKLIITASGGSFRDLSREELQNVTLEDALKHPNWNMGAKITINSATMVNKGLEVIEAHWLFGVSYDNIYTLLHNESIIHSMVEFCDTSILAHLGNPDMRVPIQYALSYPDRMELVNAKSLSLSDIKSLSFKEMDFERFKALKMAYQVGKQGGIMPCVYNAANEAALDLFLDQKIPFIEIETIVEDAISTYPNILNPTIEQIIETDQLVKQQILDKYN